LTNNYENCSAKLNKNKCGFYFPSETNLPKNGDNFYFGGVPNNSNFKADLVEIFGLEVA